ncbi:MAG: hypothetical protein DBY38_00290 [Clostridium cadaveris]|uniref:Uncharacterized protein n=1 Tax=Clostridium cadaveris TaxID=1529 RepID=A0A316MBN7_9CLOT|nr:MAG: hypothetical protein DBY38_00290 [Clostridium cadaveris]
MIIKNKKLIITLTILPLICVSLYVFIFYVKKTNEKYIAVSSTLDFENPGSTEIVTYDNNLNKLTNETINLGTGLFHIESKNKIYLFAGQSYLSINKSTGEQKKFENIIDTGVIESVNSTGDCPVLIKNIGMLTELDYDCEICIIDDLDNPKLTSFKTQNTLAADAIKFKNKIYAITSSSGASGSYFIEIYDENGTLIDKNKLYISNCMYKFYIYNDSLYLLSFSGECYSTIINKVNDDGMLNNTDTKIFDGLFSVNPINNNIYSSTKDGTIFKINLDGNKPEEIVSIKDLLPSKNNNVNSIFNLLYFYDNTFAIRSLIEVPVADSKYNTSVVFFIPEEGEYVNCETVTNLDMDNSTKGKRIVYFGKISTK